MIKMVKKYHYQIWTEEPLNLINNEIEQLLTKGSKFYQNLVDDILTDEQIPKMVKMLDLMGLKEVFEKW